MNKRGRVDLPIVICVFLLLIGGMVMVFSASSMMANTKFGSLTYFFRKQMLWGAVTFFVMIMVSRINYQKLKKYSMPLWLVVLAILLLLGLLPFGVKINGARRWYDLVIMRFQPSEFAKLALIIYSAYFLSSRGKKIQKIKEGLLPLIIIEFSVLVLILMQPDLSTSLMIAVITGSMLFVSQARLKHILAIASPIVPLVVFVISRKPYMLQRILDWIHAFWDPLSASYQIRQSLIGLGRGGVTGFGIGQSKQKFFFLPDSHTDFIFSILGEEFGFIGIVVILGLFLFLLLRGLYIAKRVSDPFGKFLVLGITLNITLYGLINASVVSMLLPATGLPMPFISYGGSHLFFAGISMGLLLSVSRQAGPAGATANWSDIKDNRTKFYNKVITVG